MGVFRDDTRLRCFLAMIFGAGVFLGGCAATINYSYDPVADFSRGKNYSWASMDKNYSWASGPLADQQEPLIEKNVCHYAHQSLRDKGFTLTSEKPDFVISMNYTLDYQDRYKVRLLNLYIYTAKGRELVWQGTAEGGLKADAASADLAEAVKKILVNFPPKKR